MEDRDRDILEDVDGGGEQRGHDGTEREPIPMVNLKEKLQSNLKNCCNPYDYLFIWKDDLESHELSVLDKVYYSCNQCEYETTSKDS